MNSVLIDSDNQNKLEIAKDSAPSFCHHYLRVCISDKESVGFYTTREKLRGLADFILDYLDNN